MNYLELIMEFHYDNPNSKPLVSANGSLTCAREENLIRPEVRFRIRWCKAG